MITTQGSRPNTTNGHETDEAAALRLHGRLVEKATKEGLLDVAYTVVDSPVGKLLLAATDRGLVRIAYESQNHDQVLDNLSHQISPRVLRAPQRLAQAARELDDYFTGTRPGFDLTLDLRLTHGFRRLVQEHLTDIAYGQTRTYSQVASAVGNPRAVRAVGTACATNPLPIVLPCHRVVRSDGEIGGYAGGPAAKHTLLTLEAVA